MTVVLLIVVAVLLVIVLVVMGALVWRSRSKGWLEQVTGQRVLVHTVDSQTVEGSLFAVMRDGVLLKAPRMIEDQPLNIAGDLFIPRSKIAMVQRPTGGDR